MLRVFLIFALFFLAIPVASQPPNGNFVRCTHDGQCQQNEFCGRRVIRNRVQRVCLPRPIVAAHRKCKRDSDCPEGEVCRTSIGKNGKPYRYCGTPITRKGVWYFY